MNGSVYTSRCADSGSESGKWYTNVSIVGDNGLAKKKESLEKTLVKKQQSLENILDNKKQSPEKIPIGFNDGQHDLKKPSPDKVETKGHGQKLTRQKLHDLKLSVRYVETVYDISAVLMLTVVYNYRCLALTLWYLTSQLCTYTPGTGSP